MSTGKLLLLRHGQSTWNLENLFTGWIDVDLSEQGLQEAHEAGRLLKAEGIEFDIAFTSVLKRAIRTLWIALDEMDMMWLPVERTWRLNERHYGALQGLNKTQTVQKHGAEQVKIWRRSYDIPPPPLALNDKQHPRFERRYAGVPANELPASESLKDTLARVLQRDLYLYFRLVGRAPQLAPLVQPGQFAHVRILPLKEALLRRPFSVYNIDGENIEIVFNVIGRGTAVLRAKQPHECIDVIGPLGKPFTFAGEDFETGVLIAGGLGVAPMPTLTRALRQAGKEVVTFLGARTRGAVTPFYLENVHLATDDGSEGHHGTVVDLARRMLGDLASRRPKLFACGPTAMLRAVAGLARETGFPCEVSLEGPMACGFGICQGCPVELADAPGRYLLMCKDGPTFDAQDLQWEVTP